MNRSTQRFWPLLLLLLMPMLMGVERPPGLGDVKAIRTWSYPKYTRVVLELSRDVRLPEAGLVRLAANRGAGKPERLYLDAGDAIGYRDAVQVGAAKERAFSDAGNAFGDLVAACSAARKTDECGLPLVEQDPIHTAVDGVGCVYRECHQAAAATERSFPNDRYAIGDRDASQGVTVRERLFPNAGDAIADRDACQPAAETERRDPDAGDGFPNDLAGNYDVSRGFSRKIGDLNGGVVFHIGEITELSGMPRQGRADEKCERRDRMFGS